MMGGRTYPQTPSLKGRGWIAASAAMTGDSGGCPLWSHKGRFFVGKWFGPNPRPLLYLGRGVLAVLAAIQTDQGATTGPGFRLPPE